jgi:hypothetical protein
LSRSAQDYKVVFFPLNGIEARDDFAVAHVASVDGSGWARGPSRADYMQPPSRAELQTQASHSSATSRYLQHLFYFDVGQHTTNIDTT